jgi:hypothetical protein
MLIAAAVCPHPPLLIPEATGHPGPTDSGPTAAGPELARLRLACRQAVSALLADPPDLLAVVGADERATPVLEYPQDAPGHLHEFGVPFVLSPRPAAAPAAPSASATPPAPDTPSLPLSLTVGQWLLSGVRQMTPPPAVWWGIAPDASPAQARELGETLAALAPRVGLLALGDGPGRRARAAPQATDPAADRYDDQVAAALAAADPAALAALDPGQDEPLVIAGRAAWQTLAAAAAAGTFTAELHYRGVPFEVSYYVASWRRMP